MLRKWCSATLVGLLSSALWAGVVHAHAVVYPKAMNANSFEKFTLRVPVEKESATVKVRIEMPEGFAVSRVRPMPGWTYTVEKAADGKTLKAVTWSGGKIEPGEFQEFEFNGKTAAEPGKYAFRAFQTYADGETVEWTGPSDADRPASFVELKATAAGTDAHGQQKPAAGHAPAPAPSPAAQEPAGTGAGNMAATAAGYGGLLLGGAALVVALRRK